MSVIRKFLRLSQDSSMSEYIEIPESVTANQFVITDLEEGTKYYVDANVLNTRGLATSTQANFTTKEVNYLCFTDVSGMTNTLTLTKSGNPDAISLEVSSDKSNWTAWTETNGVRSYTIPANGKVYVRGNNETIGKSAGNEYIFSSTENINASGSIMTLLDKTDTLRTISHDACFCRIFRYMSTLQTAPELPATEINSDTIHVYLNAFTETSIRKAPKLPATTIGNNCYAYMFSGCHNLTDVSEMDIAVSNVTNASMYSMFQSCTSLTTAPTMTVNSVGINSMYQMFMGCTSLSDVSGITINATTFAESSCSQMFKNCSSLTSVVPMTVSSVGDSIMSFNSMYCGCSQITDATNIHLDATTVNLGTYKVMFQGCTSLVTPPKINATTFYSNQNGTSNGSFSYMFDGCSSLNYIEVKFTDWNGGYGTYLWTRGCKSTGTFKCPASLPQTKNASGNVTNANYIPYNWTIDNNKTNNPQITATRTQSSAQGQVWKITITPPNYGSRTPVTTYYVVSRDGRNPTTTSTNFQAVNGTPYSFDITIVTSDFGTRYAKCYSVVSGMEDSDIVTHTFTT